MPQSKTIDPIREFKRDKQTRHYLIILVLVIMVFALILLALIKPLNPESDDIPDFPLYKTKKYRKDCDIVRVFAMDDSTCENVCSGNTPYLAKNGICINSTIVNQSETTNECDSKLGVLAILIGDPQFGSVNSYCVSIDAGVQSSNIHLPNKMCTGGKININYLEKFPQISECECETGLNKVVIPSTNVTREYAVCSKYKL